MKDHAGTIATVAELREEARAGFVKSAELKMRGKDVAAWNEGIIARRRERRADELEAAGEVSGFKFGSVEEID